MFGNLDNLALAKRYGHRGCWLMLLGVVWFAFGWASLIDPVPARAWVLVSYAPPLAQAIVWWATGLGALAVGLAGPRRDDTLGHVALYFMPAVKVISYTLAALVFFVSEVLTWVGCMDEPVGFAGGLYAATLWLLTSACLMLAASWPNPAAPVPLPNGLDLWADDE